MFMVIRYAFKLGYMKGHNAAKAEARMKQKEMAYGVDDEEESMEVWRHGGQNFLWLLSQEIILRV